MTPPHSSLWYFGPHGPLGPSGDPVALTRTASILIHSLRSRMDVSRTLDHQGFLRTILISAIMHDGKGMFRVLGSGVMVKIKNINFGYVSWAKVRVGPTQRHISPSSLSSTLLFPFARQP
jgi:hypothetical protein